MKAEKHEVTQLKRKIADLEKSGREKDRVGSEREDLIHDLGERVKELKCMYAITRSAVGQSSLDAVFKDVVKAIPPSWQYPDITCCSIVLDDKVYYSTGFQETGWLLRSPIIIDSVQRGSVNVFYTATRPESDEGPFLKEERNLIDGISVTLSSVIKSVEAEKEKEGLKAQLLHADRLATIGQLAAGVAHELNEPLGNILGFAQLSLKGSQLDGQVTADLVSLQLKGQAKSLPGSLFVKR